MLHRLRPVRLTLLCATLATLVSSTSHAVSVDVQYALTGPSSLSAVGSPLLGGTINGIFTVRYTSSNTFTGAPPIAAGPATMLTMSFSTIFSGTLMGGISLTFYGTGGMALTAQQAVNLTAGLGNLTGNPLGVFRTGAVTCVGFCGTTGGGAPVATPRIIPNSGPATGSLGLDLFAQTGFFNLSSPYLSTVTRSFSFTELSRTHNPDPSTAVPEPSAALLACFAVGAVALSRRMRR